MALLTALGCRKEVPPPARVSEMPTGKVAWRSWVDRDSSRATDRPVLLYLYTRRSYWCRRMIRDTFAREDLSRDVMRWTDPTWADADLRPDLTERFGAGGWPSVVFLAPDGWVITGSTYMDPADFERLLKRIRIYFENPERWTDLQRERGYHNAREQKRTRSRKRPSPKLSTEFLRETTENVLKGIAKADIPYPEGIRFLLEGGPNESSCYHEAATAGLSRILDSRTKAADGLYYLGRVGLDGPLLGAEKNLAMNAGILAALAHCARVDVRFKAAALRLGDAILRELLDPCSSLLFSGKAAFSEAEEGLVLILEDGSGGVDTTSITSWNAVAVSALAELHGVSEDPRLLKTAVAVFEKLLRRTEGPKGLLRRGEPDSSAALLFLEDQAFAAEAAIDLYEATGDDLFLRHAKRLGDAMISEFADPSGGFRDKVPNGSLTTDMLDRLLPAADAVAARVMARLAGETRSPGYLEASRGILLKRARLVPLQPERTAGFGRALRTYLAVKAELENED